GFSSRAEQITNGNWASEAVRRRSRTIAAVVAAVCSAAAISRLKARSATTSAVRPADRPTPAAAASLLAFVSNLTQESGAQRSPGGLGGRACASGGGRACEDEVSDRGQDLGGLLCVRVVACMVDEVQARTGDARGQLT